MTGRSLALFVFLDDVPINRLRNESLCVRSPGGGSVMMESPSESFWDRQAMRG